MKINQLKKLIPSLRIDNIDIDQTEVIEHYFFDKSSRNDYRDESVNFMINNQIDFHSTCNSAFNVMKRFVKVSCPTCKRNMESSSGGGNSITNTLSYKCPHCSTKASLTIPSDGFKVEFEYTSV